MDKILPTNSTITEALVAPGQKAKGPTDLAKVEDAARQFEGLLVQEMMKSMWQTVPKGELLSGSHEEALFRDMLNESVAKEISEGEGIGVREILVRDMKKRQGMKEK